MGKTYYTERLAEKTTASGGFVFVYNPGGPPDWKNTLEATPIHPRTIARKKGLTKTAEINRYIADNSDVVKFWEVDGKFYKSEEIPFVFRGRQLKCLRSFDMEQMIFATIFEYFHGGMLVLDDNRSSGRRTPNLLQLYARSNHTGKKYTTKPGINIAVVYHNLDTPPRELYDYLTHVVLFQVNRAPQDLKMPELEEAINDAVDWLAEAPKYSRCEIHLLGADIKTYKIKKQ